MIQTEKMVHKQLMTLFLIKKSPYLSEYRYIRDSIALYFITEHSDSIKLPKKIMEKGLSWVKHIIEHNIKIYTQKWLVYAARKGYLDVVIYLVYKGVDIHMNDECSFRWAARNGHLNVVKFLVEKGGADIHAENEYALRMSIQENHFDIVKYLVHKGVDINKDNKLFSICIKYYRMNILKFLIEQGMKINPNDMIDECIIKGDIDNVIYLVEKGIDIYFYHNISFYIAVEYGQLDIVQFFVSKGINIHLYSNRALIYACKNGHFKVVKYLVEQGASIHNGDPILHAIIGGWQDIINYLEEKGAIIKHYYIRCIILEDKLDMLKILVKEGKLDINYGGQLALRTAMENDMDHIVSYIESLSTTSK